MLAVLSVLRVFISIQSKVLRQEYSQTADLVFNVRKEGYITVKQKSLITSKILVSLFIHTSLLLDAFATGC